MSVALMTPELVRLDVAPPGDKHAVIALMAELIAGTGRAERAGLEQGLLAREESFATGMPGGFASPTAAPGRSTRPRWAWCASPSRSTSAAPTARPTSSSRSPRPPAPTTST